VRIEIYIVLPYHIVLRYKFNAYIFT